MHIHDKSRLLVVRIWVDERRRTETFVYRLVIFLVHRLLQLRFCKYTMSVTCHNLLQLVYMFFSRLHILFSGKEQ